MVRCSVYRKLDSDAGVMPLSFRNRIANAAAVKAGDSSSKNAILAEFCLEWQALIRSVRRAFCTFGICNRDFD